MSKASGSVSSRRLASGSSVHTIGMWALSHQPKSPWPLYIFVLKAQGPPSQYEPGSAADFDRLYRIAYPRVYRTLVAILADPAEAEDCAQDAFVQALKAWPRWRPDAPAEAWIHRIAVNSAISYRRRARLRSVGEVIRRLGRPSPGGDP